MLRREKETWSREEPEFFVAYNLAAQKICSIPGAPHSLGKVDSGTAFPVNPADLWVAIAANLGFAGLDAGCARLGYVEGVFEDALRFCRNLSLPSESVQVLELQMGLAKAMAARRDPETANRAYELGREAYDIAEELLRDTRNNKKESAFMAYSLAPFFMDFIDICTFCGQPRMACFTAEELADFEIEFRNEIKDPLLFAEARVNVALSMARLLRCDPNFYTPGGGVRQALSDIKNHLRHADALLRSLERDMGRETEFHTNIIPIRIRRLHAEALALSLVPGRYREAFEQYRAALGLCFSFYSSGPAHLLDLYLDEMDARNLAGEKGYEASHFDSLERWARKLELSDECLEEIRKRKQGSKEEHRRSEPSSLGR